MYMIPFLKGMELIKNQLLFILIFKSPFLNICIVAPKSLKPIDFWNSLELSSWVFKWIFLSFSFFIILVLVFLFPTSISWYRWREDLTWSCKDFEIGNYETCSMLNVLIINNSQMTLLLRYFVIILRTKLTISCEETNINSNSKYGLRIT